MGKGRRDGLVLIGVVLFLALAMTAVATFLRQATVDGLVARHRDMAAQAESLARGGVELATVLLLQDRLDETRSEETLEVESRHERWARLNRQVIRTPDGGELRVRIEDAGAFVNPNALIEDGQARSELAESFLAAWLEKVIDEVPRPEQGAPPPREPLELARNLLDWMDADEERSNGAPEDERYARRGPEAGPPNRPLLSVDELRRVEGFDPALVEAMRPYLGVYPLVAADGVNPNTAPPWVLASLFHGQPGDHRLATEDTVRRILDIREGGGILCADEADHPACTPAAEVIEGEIFPPPSYVSDVFRVTAEARYGAVRRTVRAVIDRGDPAEPKVRTWEVE